MARYKNREKNLKMCPFCGGSARLEMTRAFIGGKSCHVAVAYCRRCNARSPRFERKRDTNSQNGYNSTEVLNKAAESWNRRVWTNGIFDKVKL